MMEFIEFWGRFAIAFGAGMALGWILWSCWEHYRYWKHGSDKPGCCK